MCSNSKTNIASLPGGVKHGCSEFDKGQIYIFYILNVIGGNYSFQGQKTVNIEKVAAKVKEWSA